MKEIALAINSAICPNSVVLQSAKAMVSLKKKGLCLFLRRKMRQRELTKFLALKYGKRSSPCHFNLYMKKFQEVFAGGTKCSGGLHAARGP